LGGDGSLDMLFDGCAKGGVVERLGWRDTLADGGLCCSWRWFGCTFAALNTCNTEGTIGKDCAFTVRCLSRGEGDISRGGEFWDELCSAGYIWVFLDLCGE
jgi:hypothetical protein